MNKLSAFDKFQVPIVDPPKQGNPHESTIHDVTPSALIANVSRKVWGQHEAKAAFANALYWFQQQRRSSSAPTSRSPARRNVMLLSPRNSGMTSLIHEFARAAGLPIAEPDATEYLMAAGPQGGPKSVNDMVTLLLREFSGNTLPERGLGIISIEGIEQLAITDQETAAQKERLQQAIARLADGKTLNLAFGGKMVSLDSRRILFVISANPVGLERLVHKRLAGGGLGFQGSANSTSLQISDADAISQTNTDDLVRFGFTSAFLAAFQIRAALRPLSQVDLLNICQMDHSPVDFFRETFARLGVVLEVTPQALIDVTTAASDLGIGARGITAVLHDMLDPIAIRLADDSNSVQRVILGELGIPPEIVFGPSLVAPGKVALPTCVQPHVPDYVHRLFPNGLPRRPARPNNALSATRWANKSDLARWLSPITNTNK